MASRVAALDPSLFLAEYGGGVGLFQRKRIARRAGRWCDGDLFVVDDTAYLVARYAGLDEKILRDAERMLWWARNVGAHGQIEAMERYNERVAESNERCQRADADACARSSYRYRVRGDRHFVIPGRAA